MPKICLQRKLRNMAKNNKKIEGKLEEILIFLCFFIKKYYFCNKLIKPYGKEFQIE